ncbi:DNA topoisomerase 3-beta-1 [Sarcoptes scabiei]|uniref:DNA topoisomerase n=1 Tax=Sarcoptes scabiei TaxID=52283 RepID=A0A132AC67_SARSC|nr:DNA topoisomerase 3-beta-1 [Sarcoptes scabiei]KPM08572.1 DNA topoisomerase 3-beta-1-like protein [Sarcoptes scabiei]
MSVLMIAEKPSLAQSLAQILSNGRMNSRRNASSIVHEYRGSFLGNRNTMFKFTSVCGHLFTADFEPKYKNWDNTEPIDLYSARIVRVEANPKLHLVQFLQREARGCKYLVLWLDCDKEGENICFEIIDTVSSAMHISFYNPQAFFRAHFSAITPKDIRFAFDNLRLPNELESLSVQARQDLDLIVGCSFTRYQTRFFHGKYGDLDSSLISYGPCQVPTLTFCVDRDDEIKNFKSQPFWTLSAVVATIRFVEQFIDLKWMGEPEFSLQKIKQIHSGLKNVKNARIVSVEKTQKMMEKPKPLNTVEMLKVASAKFGIGPHTAMQIAEKLYTQGYISYPRTETTKYAKNFDFDDVLNILKSNRHWADDIKDLIAIGYNPSKSGHDAGDHPPITPLKSATSDELYGEQWKIYDYITRHFLATLSTKLISDVFTIVVKIGSESFQASYTEVVQPGFTRFLPKSSDTSDKSFRCVKEGDPVLVSEVKINDHMTQPPCHLSESELISLMEKHGIGTDASIPTHINNICQRNYVEISSDRRLIPTKLGILLVHGYRRIDNELVSSDIRSNMEKELNEIAKAKKSFDFVRQRNIDYYRIKFMYFVENINLMDELFGSHFTSVVETGKPFSKCGKCKRFMRLIETKPVRLICPACNETYNVPKDGTIKKFKEEKCPIDDFDLLYYNGNKMFIFCPNCYNDPPFEDMLKQSECFRCTNDSCQYSKRNNTLCQCLSCDYQGLLMLEQGSAPNWKFVCTKCTFSITLFKGISKIRIEKEKCENCQSNLIDLQDPKQKILPNGMKKFRGCLWCSSDLNSFADSLRVYSNTYRNLSQRNPHTRGRTQGRGRGRGGGRDGNNNGRGQSKATRGRGRGGTRRSNAGNYRGR